MLSIELIQQVIYSIALGLLLVDLSRLPRYSLFFSSLLFVLLVIGVNLIPIYHGSSLVELLRGAVGDVSIASGGLLLLIIVNQFNFSDRRKRVLSFFEKALLIVTGFVLYLSTFGFIGFDIYRLGYLSSRIPLYFSVVLMILIFCNRRLGYVWLLAWLGFYYQLQYSNNLWDYLYDPVLWAVLIIDFIYHLVYLRKKRIFEQLRSY